jgi:hypothetical protein
MLTPAAAEKLIFSHLAPFHREDCPLAQAHGRSLRADLCADRDLPPFDRVTMDGYALRAASLAAGLTEFGIQGVQAAGMRPFQLGPAPGACLEIMTGAVLPAGADCIVPYEETTRAATGATITVAATAAHFSAGHAVHRRGSDHRAGDVIVREGTRLTPIGGSRTLGSHKGYGLACMVELLCSMLAGGWYAPTRAARGRREDPRPNIGHFFLVIDPAQFRAPGEFEHDLEDMLGALRQVPPSDAAQPVLVPGDTEAAAMRQRLAEGVPLPDPLVQQLRQIATRCGAPVLL